MTGEVLETNPEAQRQQTLRLILDDADQLLALYDQRNGGTTSIVTQGYRYNEYGLFAGSAPEMSVWRHRGKGLVGARNRPTDYIVALHPMSELEVRNESASETFDFSRKTADSPITVEQLFWDGQTQYPEQPSNIKLDELHFWLGLRVKELESAKGRQDQHNRTHSFLGRLAAWWRDTGE
jgi:hypothetical protein